MDFAYAIEDVQEVSRANGGDCDEGVSWIGR